MSTGLKCIFFGSSLVSAYWNGAATYYRGIISALHKRGHQITFVEPDAYDRQKHRDIENPSYAKSIVYEATEDGVHVALKIAKGADVIIKTSGVGVFDSLLESEVLSFQNNNTKVVFWDVDAPATLDRIKNNSEDPFRNLIPLYDMILTYGGGEPVINTYKSFGARDCIPVYNALDPSTHYPVKAEQRFEATLGFLGNRLPDREERVHEFFFKPARALQNKGFILGGNGWDQHVPDVANVNRIGHVYTYEHNAFNCSALAVLNINRASMAKNGFSPATRVFEAAGAGACIISDAFEGMEQFLKPDSECLVATDGDEVIRHLKNIDKYEAQKIGNAARDKVLTEHTYTQRAAIVERVLG